MSVYLFTAAFHVKSSGLAQTALASVGNPWMMPDEVSKDAQAIFH